MPYPTSRPETVADGAVHLLGIALSIPAGIWMVQLASDPTLPQTATALYVVCLVCSFAISALYHLLPFERSRPLLGRIDHVAIYFKIAGTYTPLVMMIGLPLGYAILGLVWFLAGVGGVAKLFFWRTDAKGSLALYLGMGWLSVLLIHPMWQGLPGAAVALIMVGGLIYSAGTRIYAHPGIRFQNAIWHGFVLIASICFFVAIALSLQAQTIS